MTELKKGLQNPQMQRSLLISPDQDDIALVYILQRTISPSKSSNYTDVLKQVGGANKIYEHLKEPSVLYNLKAGHRYRIIKEFRRVEKKALRTSIVCEMKSVEDYIAASKMKVTQPNGVN